MLFADDEREANPTSFKFLQMAHAWKNKQATTGGSSLLTGFTAPAPARDENQEDDEDEDEEGDASSVASSGPHE
jgi:crooked neck